MLRIVWVGRNLLFDIALGITGALIGGWLFSQNNIFIDLICAAALLVFVQAISNSSQ
jgi:uncharacterized membrane protein YeaQ/YmgE (transglycosylase-associated protein family)